MSCESPDRAWRPKVGKKLVFNPRYALQPDDPILLPCRRCDGCAMEDARQKAARAKDELSVCGDSCFITLTYSDEFLPFRGSLCKRDFQLFMKRLRKQVSKRWGVSIRVMYSGEYGDLNWRPHFHAILFGYDFSDKSLWRVSGSGHDVFRSLALQSLWPFGYCEIGSAGFESASYVARYTIKKYSNRFKKGFYERVDESTGEIFDLEPEFCEYPRGRLGGLGFPWLHRFFRDVFPNDIYLINGVRCSPPKYYLDKYRQHFPQHCESIDQIRIDKNRKFARDNTSERLRVKGIVARSKSEFYNIKRSI